MKKDSVIRKLSLVVLVTIYGCDNSSTEFLGCEWNIQDLTFRGDGSYASVAFSPPIVTEPYTVDFETGPFREPDFGFELEGTNEIDFGIQVRHYTIGADLPMSGSDFYVLQRPGFEGHVAIHNRSYSEILVDCN